MYIISFISNIVSLEIIQIWRSIPEKAQAPRPKRRDLRIKGMPIFGPRKNDWRSRVQCFGKIYPKEAIMHLVYGSIWVYIGCILGEYLGNKLPSSTRRFSSWNWVTWRTSWSHDSESWHFTSLSLAFQWFYSRFQVLVGWDTLLTSAPSQHEIKTSGKEVTWLRKGGSSRGEGW